MLAIAFFLSAIWIRSYDLWFGVDGLILKYFPGDGEAAHDHVILGMFMICLLLELIIYFSILFSINNTSRQPQK